MPDLEKIDWGKIVRERMQSPNAPRTVDEEVIAELAAHLAEAYEHAKSHGMTETAALEATLQEVTDWRVLAQDIIRAQSREVDMNDRIKRWWLLAAVTWLGATLSLNVADRIDHPELILRRPIPVMFPLPWLATLILVGAAGAFLAQRADAPRKTRLLVATSPALLLGIVMLLLLPGRFADGYPWALTFFAIDAENWVVVPGLALLLGALPFLWQPSANSFPLPTGDVNASMHSTALPE